jgi:hypothetical protein
VRRFLPSWSCEFDSRHPLHAKALVKDAFRVAVMLRQDILPCSGPYVDHCLRRRHLAPGDPAFRSWSCEFDSVTRSTAFALVRLEIAAPGHFEQSGLVPLRAHNVPKIHDGPCSIRASEASAMTRSRVMVRCR